MKKKILVISAILILALSTVTAVYAKGNNSIGYNGFRMPMMDQSNNSTYNKMISLMREKGFEDAALAMQNRDFEAMNKFMNNLTDEQYNKMKDIMNSNGYGNMAKMMGSIDRNEMVNIHNSMMGR